MVKARVVKNKAQRANVVGQGGGPSVKTLIAESKDGIGANAPKAARKTRGWSPRAWQMSGQWDGGLEQASDSSRVGEAGREGAREGDGDDPCRRATLR
jgi:hypothetical protein